MRSIAFSAFASCLLVTACASPERSKLERGMAYAKREFLRAGRNPIAALSLGSITQMGGNLSSYLYAAMPDKSDLPQFQDDQPSGPWSIALRATAGDRVIIEGYGATLDRPLVAETVLVKRPTSPKPEGGRPPDERLTSRALHRR